MIPQETVNGRTRDSGHEMQKILLTWCPDEHHETFIKMDEAAGKNLLYLSRISIAIFWLMTCPIIGVIDSHETKEMKMFVFFHFFLI